MYMYIDILKYILCVCACVCVCVRVCRRTCIWRSSWRRRTSSRTLRCTMSTPTTGRVLSTCTAHTNYGTMPYA